MGSTNSTVFSLEVNEEAEEAQHVQHVGYCEGNHDR